MSLQEEFYRLKTSLPLELRCVDSMLTLGETLPPHYVGPDIARFCAIDIDVSVGDNLRGLPLDVDTVCMTVKNMNFLLGLYDGWAVSYIYCPTPTPTGKFDLSLGGSPIASGVQRYNQPFFPNLTGLNYFLITSEEPVHVILSRSTVNQDKHEVIWTPDVVYSYIPDNSGSNGSWWGNGAAYYRETFLQ